MNRSARFVVLLIVLLLALPPVAPTLAQGGDEEITLVPFTNDDFAIQGLAPEGWTEVAPGVYARGAAGDVTSLIQQAAPGVPMAQLTGLLLSQLGIEALPESAGIQETAAFAWDLYVIEVEAAGMTIMVDLALAETDAGTYLVLLQTSADEYEALHEAVFLPAVEALAPLGAEEAEGEVYADPGGLFTVPVPTNWTAEHHEDGYGILTAPDDEIIIYVLAVEADDMQAGVDAAWAIVDPDFDLEQAEFVESPPTGAHADAEQTVAIIYDTGDEEELVLGGGWLYEGIAYMELIQTSLVALQQRLSQVQIIDSGFTIIAMEQIDLAGVEPLPLSEELMAEFEAYVLESMERFNVPGASIAIVQGGEIVYAEGFGVREMGGDDPVTPETLMMIGSATKTMTTMLMAILVDEGLMDWDTPVIDILPTFEVADPEISQQITMRHMVCACTGVPRRDYEFILNADQLSAEAVIESLADFEFFTDFGEAFQYSNQMVATAGYLATLAAGGEYGELYDDYLALMQERIFDPIGMSGSTFSFDEVQASENHATPHGLNMAYQYVPLSLETEELLIPVTPAGLLWSNALDMARYMITELNEGIAPDGTRIVSAENLALTWEPQVAVTADVSYGLGWIVADYHGLLQLSHGGNTFGFTADFAFLPDADLGIVVLTNQQVSMFNQAVRARLFELVYGLEPELDELLTYALERSRDSTLEAYELFLDEIDVDVITPYLGTYSNEALGEVTIALEDGVLFFDAGEVRLEIRQIDPERENAEDDEGLIFLVCDPPLAGVSAIFQEDDNGEPIIVMGSGVVEYTFERVE